MKSFGTILKTEIKLSLRGMDMLIFSILMPLVILVVIGLIYGSKPAFEGADYTFVEQSFGALASVSICAGGTMGLPLVVADYRSKQILKRFKVTPVSPVTILLAEVAVFVLYSLCSLLTLMIVARVFFNFRFRGDPGVFMAGWLIVIISIFSIGLMVGGIAKNSKIAGIIASAVYFPMLIFSGATLPYEVMPSAMQKIVDFLPMTQGIKMLKTATLGLPTEQILVPVVIMIAIGGICSFVAVRFFKWE
ncbi:MAG: ABC transporter permease [Oscillospiraceae bacterium]|jgi:ABC-2 type transport system permease protein|nr:ABC transporter permease [Oscillospiraceae bacterium]